jgi:hypothetical protein
MDKVRNPSNSVQTVKCSIKMNSKIGCIKASGFVKITTNTNKQTKTETE